MQVAFSFGRELIEVTCSELILVDELKIIETEYEKRRD